MKTGTILAVGGLGIVAYLILQQQKASALGTSLFGNKQLPLAYATQQGVIPFTGNLATDVALSKGFSALTAYNWGQTGPMGNQPKNQVSSAPTWGNFGPGSTTGTVGDPIGAGTYQNVFGTNANTGTGS